jgi:2-dehydro-3-deoxygalactonokinase
MTTKIAEWIAVDWGTSNFRAWVFDADGGLIDLVTSDRGMGSLAPEEFEPALIEAIGHFLGKEKTPVICCGMVGAKQGWQEAPYASVPCEPAQSDTALRVTPKDARLLPYILPGLKQDSPADVMRGEETQIAGYLSQHPKFDGVLCLPGTHTKWVHISAGEVVSFRTFMTGELFALLSNHSVLRHSVQDKGWDDTAFQTAISDAMSHPQLVASKLFGLRAEGVLHGQSNATAKARLSGMLIGLELAGSKPYWLGQNVAIVGDPVLSALYAAGLNGQDVPATQSNGDEITVEGLKSAYNLLIGNQK